MNRTTVRLFFFLLAGALLFAVPGIGKDTVTNGGFQLGNIKFVHDYWTMEGLVGGTWKIVNTYDVTGGAK